MRVPRLTPHKLVKCSTWGERAWEFAVGLIMLELHPSSLLYVSLFGLLDAAVLVVFGAAVGAYVDRWVTRSEALLGFVCCPLHDSVLCSHAPLPCSWTAIAMLRTLPAIILSS
jgi:hypothetical protein